MTESRTRAKDGRLLAIAKWRDNGHLIAEVAELHLSRDMKAVDLTYGNGIWWKQWEPDSLVRHDLNPEKGDGVSFLQLPEPDGTYQLVAYDPPYVCPGGRETTSLDEDSDLWDRFGMDMTPANPGELRPWMKRGFCEAHRVCRRKGIVLFKCQDFNWGGTYHPVTHWAQGWADELDMEIVDRFDLVTQASRQPKGRVQRTAARNGSTLFVFRRTRPSTAQLGLALS